MSVLNVYTEFCLCSTFTPCVPCISNALVYSDRPPYFPRSPPMCRFRGLSPFASEVRGVGSRKRGGLSDAANSGKRAGCQHRLALGHQPLPPGAKQPNNPFLPVRIGIPRPDHVGPWQLFCASRGEPATSGLLERTSAAHFQSRRRLVLPAQSAPLAVPQDLDHPGNVAARDRRAGAPPRGRPSCLH